MHRVVLAAIALGVIGVVAGLVIALLPLHANGVSGNAFTPQYRSFAFAFNADSPAPPHPSRDYLRSQGVRLPQDVVADRRSEAQWTASAGAAIVLAGFIALRRRSG